ncbi:MAG: phage late control D family protein [Anaerolineae bacterium]|nr:phage late control D family protein [Anaerolineae bacterium]
MLGSLLNALPRLLDQGDRSVPDWVLRLNGVPAPPGLRADLLSLEIYSDVNLPGMLTLRLLNWDNLLHTVSWSDSPLLEIGTAIEAELGYLNETTKLFDGEITGLEPEFEVNRAPVLVVRAHDRRHRLMRGVKTRTFLKQQDSQIAMQIASSAGLKPQAEPTTDILDYVVQNAQTDYEFLLERARRIGFEVVVEGSRLFFRKRQVKGRSRVMLSPGTNLVECYPRLSSMNQVSEVQVRGWDATQKKEIVGKATSLHANMAAVSGPGSVKRAFGKAEGQQVHQPVTSKGEADTIAQGQLEEAALGYITVDGLCQGEPDLVAGTVITLQDLGKRFSGDYYVTSAHHQLDADAGYKTGFIARRNAS